MAEGTDGPLSRFIPARAPGFDSVSEGSGFELLVHFYIDAAGVGQMTGNPWSSCGACARVRDAVIGFPALGALAKSQAAMAARDVPAEASWAFRDHRTMAEVIAEETAAAFSCGLLSARCRGADTSD